MALKRGSCTICLLKSDPVAESKTNIFHNAVTDDKKLAGLWATRSVFCSPLCVIFFNIIHFEVIRPFFSADLIHIKLYFGAILWNKKQKKTIFKI